MFASCSEVYCGTFRRILRYVPQNVCVLFGTILQYVSHNFALRSSECLRYVPQNVCVMFRTILRYVRRILRYVPQNFDSTIRRFYGGTLCKFFLRCSTIMLQVNNIPTCDSAELIIMQFKSFVATIKQHSTTHNHRYLP